MLARLTIGVGTVTLEAPAYPPLTIPVPSDSWKLLARWIANEAPPGWDAVRCLDAVANGEALPMPIWVDMHFRLLARGGTPTHFLPTAADYAAQQSP